MSSQKEKNLFAERLKSALTNARHPISPTYLSKEFNYRYDGPAISVQSANNWLLGKAIPSQDKLAILAIWLNVSNQWLRFGDHDFNPAPQVSEHDTEDLDYYLKFRSLKNTQKDIIKKLIDEFNQL
ncbi:MULTISPECIES: hypothetical protein [unclassified Acinetobacter]|jgi:hypothetical protein|uniref:hypothetical protein n=1 Tax=unclassified Acinetobacter TaxID=196816 RepID=UPI0015D2CF1A|nr:MULTISPECIES: hypothetical protein [unclassified Acinetobacter]WPC35686.1 hypothetical protein O4M77_04470 [Acinetobacter sp. YWS30-1]